MTAARLSDFRRMRFLSGVLGFRDDLGAPRDLTVAPEVATRAVAKVLRGMVAAVVLGLLFLAGFVVTGRLSADAEAEFARVNPHTQGTVTLVSRPRKGSDSLVVTYVVGGSDHTGRLTIHANSPEYRAGDPITVIYRRADPTDIAAPGIPNQSAWVDLAIPACLVVGLALVVVGGIGLARWGRGGTTWRSGPVRAEVHDRRVERFLIAFEDGSVADLTPAWLARPVPANFFQGQALATHRDQRWTVVLATGPVFVAARSAV